MKIYRLPQNSPIYHAYPNTIDISLASFKNPVGRNHNCQKAMTVCRSSAPGNLGSTAPGSIGRDSVGPGYYLVEGSELAVEEEYNRPRELTLQNQ
jgi:hypothetical protein